MIENAWIRRIVPLSIALLLAACASSPPAEKDPAAASNDPKPAAPGQTRYKWSKATEAEVAAALDKKFEEAAKSFVKLKRNDQVMFCKRYRDIGSMIPQLHCITEAQLRQQVEDSDQARDRMRQRMGRCDLTSGCGAGPDPASRVPLPQ